MPVRFSPAVESAIAEVCPPRDAFDAADFDAVEYLNSRFPDEASLAALPTFLNETRQRLRKNENELLKAVEAQAIGGPSSTSTDLATAKDAVAELNERVADIRAKASQSEETVQNLCQHIRDLDIAKTNLTASISTLRSIQLWMLQLQGLSTSFEKRRFIQCRDALLEAKKYSAMFEAMKDMPKVKELNDKQGQLCKQVEYYIRNTVFGNIAVDAMDEHTMAEACTVVDVMGTESIKKIRDRFIEKSLEGYTTRFKRGSDDAKLERTERRFVFIRTLLEQYDGIFKNVFPRHWCVPQELCVSFCIRTKQELDFHLRENSGSMDVVVLTYVLQKTIDVERDLTHMMAWPEEFAAKRDLPVYRYNGIILSAFKEHMGLFVQNEDKLMREALAQPLVGQAEAPCPGWASVEEEVRVGTSLPMAEDLFVFIKESLKRSLRIAQQEVLVEMAGVWRIHLIQYAAAVQGILPRPAITPIDIRRACIIINTADLCQTTSADLGAEVCARSDAPPSEVAFQTVVDAFSALYSKAVQNIVLGIEVAVAQPLYDYGNRYGGTGAKDGKGGAEEVGGVQDESPLIRAMTTTLHATVLLCAAVLPPQTLRFVLYKTAACIIPQFVHSLYRFRRVQEEAISSIRVDSAAFERTFLQLPTYNDPDRYDSATLSGYTKLVRREFDHLNRALKILQVDARDGTFVELYYDVTAPEDRSIQHFVRLVELKGLKRAQVRPWIAALSKRGVVESTKRDEAREAALGIATGNNAAVAAPGSNANNNNNSGGGINFAALFSRDQTNASPSNTGNTGFSFTNFVNSIGHNNNNGSK